MHYPTHAHLLKIRLSIYSNAFAYYYLRETKILRQEDMTKLQHMLSSIRRELNIKGPELAELVGVAQPTISRIENGSSTSYEIGKTIESLYQKHCSSE